MRGQWPVATSIWPEGWIHFASVTHLVFGIAAVILGALLVTWWSQQTGRWYAVFAGSLLFSTVLNVAAFYLFVVPPHSAGCIDFCPGSLGFPLPYATLSPSGDIQIFVGDFLLNLMLLWLLFFGAVVFWRILGEAILLKERGYRFRVLFTTFFVLLTWGLLPRYINPPAAYVTGDELRLSVNARRAAESTYGVTGLWVHRLALEDIRYVAPDVPDVSGSIDKPQARVCLRGYTYFYIPWRRYRVQLDATGVTPLNLAELTLTGSCWQPQTTVAGGQ